MFSVRIRIPKWCDWRVTYEIVTHWVIVTRGLGMVGDTRIDVYSTGTDESVVAVVHSYVVEIYVARALTIVK